MSGHDEFKLPKWAQDRIFALRQQIQLLEGLRVTHAVLAEGHDWFVLRNVCGEDEEHRKLFVLYLNNAHPVCDVGPDDVIIVGRKCRYVTEGVADPVSLEGAGDADAMALFSGGDA